MAYNSPSDLVLPGSSVEFSDPPLLSRSGVRQGDPLGPLLFSVAIRAILEDLSHTLGPNKTVLAYLDDVYILSSDSDPLPDVLTFFDSQSTTLKLNPSKCTSVSFEEIRTNGKKILGSFIGPRDARSTFLDNKVTAQVEKFRRLSDLPAHHSLLLLRSCLQQDLRHLQRSLKTDDLIDQWAKLDDALFTHVKSLRASPNGPRDDEVISLPARFGGMGVLSHRECAPHAYKAASESADAVLAPLFGDLRGDQTEDSFRSQGERCVEALTARREELLASLGDKERKTLVESGTVLGRRWLSAIPWNASQTLSDFEISSALHYRLLTPSSSPCGFCGSVATFGHDEVCSARLKFTYLRHNAIVHSLEEALKTVSGTRVEVEPASIGQTMERNDLRIWGSIELGSRTTEHDVKVYSLLGDKAHSSRGRVALTVNSTTPEFDRVLSQSIRYLTRIAKEARNKAPEGIGEFGALVFSTGGLVDEATQRQLDSWKGAVGTSTWGWTIRRISMGLIRARARTWTVRRV